MIERFEATFGNTREAAVQRGKRSGVKRRAVSVGRIPEVFQPYASQFGLFVRELIDKLMKRLWSGPPN